MNTIVTQASEITDVEEQRSLWFNLKPVSQQETEATLATTLYMTFGQSIEQLLAGMEPTDVEGDDLIYYASDSHNYKLLLWCSGKSKST